MILSAANQKPIEESVAAKNTASRGCASYLETHLRDPDSLSIDSVTQSVESAGKAGSYTVYTYMDIRARNGFGGMNRERYMCQADVTGPNYNIKRMDKTP